MNKQMTVPEEHLKRLKNISQAMKVMRFVDGGTQDGYTDVGLTRSQIQHVESGGNISLLKLFSVLDALGYRFSDLTDVE